MYYYVFWTKGQGWFLYNNVPAQDYRVVSMLLEGLDASVKECRIVTVSGRLILPEDIGEKFFEEAKKNGNVRSVRGNKIRDFCKKEEFYLPTSTQR